MLGGGVTVLVVGLVGPFEGAVVGGDQLCGGGVGSVEGSFGGIERRDELDYCGESTVR